MDKWIKKALFVVLSIVIVLFILFVGFGAIYQYGGLKYYVGVVNTINKMSEPEKTQEKKDFYGDSSDIREYRGILAGINKTGTGGIWVWGRLGLKYLPAKGGAGFYFSDVCSGVQKIFISDNQVESTIVKVEEFSDIRNWSNKVGTGYFVVVLSDVDISLFNGRLTSVFAYNGRFFLQDVLKPICER